MSKPNGPQPPVRGSLANNASTLGRKVTESSRVLKSPAVSSQVVGHSGCVFLAGFASPCVLLLFVGLFAPHRFVVVTDEEMEDEL